MTTARLRPCPRCARHVRLSEEACPFCAGSLDSSFRADKRAPVPPSPPRGPSGRLSRAALFAVGAGAAVLAPAALLDCSSDGYAVLPPYGHGPVFDGGEEAQDGSFVAPDVQVASQDAGDSSAEDASDSSAEDAGDSAADAGNPPPDGGTD